MVSRGAYVPTKAAFDGALQLSLDAVLDIEACVLNLDEADFHKTMAAIKAPGLMQDVYYTVYEGHRLYVKLQIGNFGKAVVISFKRDERHEP